MSSTTDAKTLTRPEILSRIQQLQTIAVEASTQLRSQCTKVIQNQAIRLEDMVDTEVEDADGLDTCMDELLLGVLYTELRKDIRHVTDSLIDMQYMLLQSRKRITLAPAPSARRNSVKSWRRLSSSVEQAEPSDDDVDDDNGSGSDVPPALSSAADTFRTAQDVPLFEDDNEDPGDSSVSIRTTSQAVEEASRTIQKLEQTLYDSCVEIDEWRRTRCIIDFIETTSFTNSQQTQQQQQQQQQQQRKLSAASTSTTSSRRNLAMEQLIREARGRIQRQQRQHQTSDGPSEIKPEVASRLLQAEREMNSLRVPLSEGSSSASSPTPLLCKPTFDQSPSPSSQPSSEQPFQSLHLLDSAHMRSHNIGDNNGDMRHYRTIADDVRIVGWVTKGTGLDVHTEFKVVVHLARGENQTIMRRYTDFAVLREVLCERYYTFRKRIPHLPPKKAFGKFEDKFLRKRESGLQFFLAYVMLHPVIGCSTIIRQWINGGMGNM